MASVMTVFILCIYLNSFIMLAKWVEKGPESSGKRLDADYGPYSKR